MCLKKIFLISKFLKTKLKEILLFSMMFLFLSCGRQLEVDLSKSKNISGSKSNESHFSSQMMYEDDKVVNLRKIIVASKKYQDILTFGSQSTVNINQSRCYVNLNHGCRRPTGDPVVYDSRLWSVHTEQDRLLLFSSPEVQESAESCFMYAKLLKTECQTNFPAISYWVNEKGEFSNSQITIDFDYDSFNANKYRLPRAFKNYFCPEGFHSDLNDTCVEDGFHLNPKTNQKESNYGETCILENGIRGGKERAALSSYVWDYSKSDYDRSRCMPVSCKDGYELVKDVNGEIGCSVKMILTSHKIVDGDHVYSYKCHASGGDNDAYTCNGGNNIIDIIVRCVGNTSAAANCNFNFGDWASNKSLEKGDITIMNPYALKYILNKNFSNQLPEYFVHLPKAVFVGIKSCSAPDGKYCPSGKGVAQACPAGKYCKDSVAKDCPEGKYSEGSKSECTPCKNKHPDSNVETFKYAKANTSASCVIAEVTSCKNQLVVSRDKLQCVTAGSENQIVDNSDNNSQNSNNQVVQDLNPKIERDPIPVIYKFIVPKEFNGNIINAGIGIYAVDDKAVVGYMVTEDLTTPKYNDSRWSTQVPSSIELSDKIGSKTLYAWVKDDDGNVSLGVMAQTKINCDDGFYYDDSAQRCIQKGYHWDPSTKSSWSNYKLCDDASSSNIKSKNPEYSAFGYVWDFKNKTYDTSSCRPLTCKSPYLLVKVENDESLKCMSKFKLETFSEYTRSEKISEWGFGTPGEVENEYHKFTFSNDTFSNWQINIMCSAGWNANNKPPYCKFPFGNWSSESLSKNLRNGDIYISSGEILKWKNSDNKFQLNNPSLLPELFRSGKRVYLATDTHYYFNVTQQKYINDLIPDALECIAPKGSYCPQKRGLPLSCPAGFFCKDGVKSSCPIGEYSEAGQSACTACPASNLPTFAISANFVNGNRSAACSFLNIVSCKYNYPVSADGQSCYKNVLKEQMICTFEGSLESKTIDINITVNDSVRTKKGFYFIAAVNPKTGFMFTYKDGTWMKFNGENRSILGIPSNGTLYQYQTQLFKDANLSQLNGVELYLGYGVGDKVSAAFKNFLLLKVKKSTLTKSKKIKVIKGTMNYCGTIN